MSTPNSSSPMLKLTSCNNSSDVLSALFSDVLVIVLSPVLITLVVFFFLIKAVIGLDNGPLSLAAIAYGQKKTFIGFNNTYDACSAASFADDFSFMSM
jgi:hypothetical protein